jgi:hypothetical protein
LALVSPAGQIQLIPALPNLKKLKIIDSRPLDINFRPLPSLTSLDCDFSLVSRDVIPLGKSLRKVSCNGLAYMNITSWTTLQKLVIKGPPRANGFNFDRLPQSLTSLTLPWEDDRGLVFSVLGKLRKYHVFVEKR